ncbi:demethylmenaquinone methyltransferase [Aeromicrobium sp. YIM 150415]|uniref:RraA family protein n=1 Tax=Aeromicrobium sp. YIM 150415 TaxID=2803912 RepID=UPI0019650F53|nr:demethylmenaquinone methyltransferase [Aeromicrobium sp. YIM 150415]MBM9463594.1 demethylmenaquinone methyltransferase [Aeromicrobium sp. YIM 150415]
MNELLPRLSALDTGALSDVLDREGIEGAVRGLNRLSGHAKVVGRAVTVELGLFTGAVPDRHLCSSAVDSSDGDSVIVVANEGRTDAASWGGILSFGAVERGVAGVVIDGATRDLDEVIELGLPLYAKTAVPVSARGRYVEVGWNRPVKMNGVTVRPGDFIIADASGVMVIPAERAEHLVAVAEEVVAAEKALVEQVRSGRAVSAVMGKNYETLAQAEA